jgi:hypothetical protein
VPHEPFLLATESYTNLFSSVLVRAARIFQLLWRSRGTNHFSSLMFRAARSISVRCWFARHKSFQLADVSCGTNHFGSLLVRAARTRRFVRNECFQSRWRSRCWLVPHEPFQLDAGSCGANQFSSLLVRAAQMFSVARAFVRHEQFQLAAAT